MPATTTIAVLDVDEKGAVTSIDKTRKAFTKMEGGMSKSASKVAQNTKKMQSSVTKNLKSMTIAVFSLQTAALAMVGAFSLGGIIRGLKDMLTEATKLNGSFNDVVATTAGIKTGIVEAVAEMEGFKQAVADLNSGLINTVASFTLISRLFSLTETIRSGSASDKFGALLELKDLIGDVGKEFDQVVRKMEARVRAARANLVDPRAGTVSLEPGEIYGPVFEDGIQNAIGLQNQFNDELRDFVELGPVLWEPVVAYGNAWADVGVILEEDVIPTVDRLATSYEKLGSVASAAGSLISAAARTGIITQREAARLMMAIRAVQATQDGMIQLAAAAAAAARYDFGAAILHKISAGLYFASAAVSGVGAISGGGSGGGGARGGIGGQGPGLTPPVRNTNVTIVVQGPISGETRYDIGREIIDLINEGQSDGMVVVR